MTDPWKLPPRKREELRRELVRIARRIRDQGDPPNRVAAAINGVILACHDAGLFEAGMIFAGASTILRHGGGPRLLAAVAMLAADIAEEDSGPFSPN